MFGKRGTFKFVSKPNEAAAESSAPPEPIPTTTDKQKCEPIDEVAEEPDDAVEEVKEVIEKPATLKRPATNENEVDTTAAEDSTTTPIKLSKAAKKRRNRIRVRGGGGRDNVDIDDAEQIEDTEKFSTWLPPQNQSGDGSTNLNDKYGY